MERISPKWTARPSEIANVFQETACWVNACSRVSGERILGGWNKPILISSSEGRKGLENLNGCSQLCPCVIVPQWFQFWKDTHLNGTLPEQSAGLEDGGDSARSCSGKSANTSLTTSRIEVFLCRTMPLADPLDTGTCKIPIGKRGTASWSSSSSCPRYY